MNDEFSIVSLHSIKQPISVCRISPSKTCPIKGRSSRATRMYFMFQTKNESVGL